MIAKAGMAEPIVLAAAQPDPTGIAVDDTHVYWGNSLTGEIMRVAKPGAGSKITSVRDPMFVVTWVGV